MDRHLKDFIDGFEKVLELNENPSIFMNRKKAKNIYQDITFFLGRRKTNRGNI